MLPWLHFRWLGVAGIEFTVGDQVLAIDPFFTRPPLRRFWYGRMQPDLDLAFEKLPRCDHILITHAHYDHLMDVPGLASRTGAHVYGSPNTCQICASAGLAQAQIHSIAAGDRVNLGAFAIQVFTAKHMRMPVDWLVNGKLHGRLRFPLRLQDYRMDCCFSFLIESQGQRFFTGSQPVGKEEATRADVLFYIPLRPKSDLRKTLAAVQPRLVVPVHWDDQFSPLSRPIQTSYKPPWNSFPPLQRLDLEDFKRDVERLAPGTEVLVPEIFSRNSLMGNKDG